MLFGRTKSKLEHLDSCLHRIEREREKQQARRDEQMTALSREQSENTRLILDRIDRLEENHGKTTIEAVKQESDIRVEFERRIGDLKTEHATQIGDLKSDISQERAARETVNTSTKRNITIVGVGVSILAAFSPLIHSGVIR